ncbi:MAG: oligopeptide ABC transporter permease OppB [Alphaproteobacteria bacterium]|nr:oligopeptide ABC transporter permease OppB [Alphaproteobacteria bacterium]
MFYFTLKRLFWAVPTLLLIITIAFFLMRIAPGGPFSKERPVAPEILANINKVYHLDESLPEQYVRYLGNILQGDLGPSYKYKDFTVNELIGLGFPVSAQIGGIAILLALLIGVSLGILAALRQNTPTDYTVMTVAMFGITIPTFVTAPFMTLVFGVLLKWLPIGWDDDNWTSLIMPIIALSLPQIAIIARLMRGSMIEVLRSNYVRTARAKGLSERLAILRHSLKPAMVPVLSYIGPAVAGIITGSIIIEQTFNIPGIGRHFVQGALNRDYPMVMGVTILYGALIVFFNLVVDIIYGFLDPKVRYD